MAQAPGGISLIPVGQTPTWEQARTTLQTDLDTLTTQINSLAGVVAQIQNAGVNLQTNPNTITNVPIIRAYGRLTQQIAAATCINYVVGSSDATFAIFPNLYVVSGSSFNFHISVTSYVDQSPPSSGTTTFELSQAGLLVVNATNTLGIGAYNGFPLTIRGKANTTISVSTQGGGGSNFTSVVYNFEATVIQIH